jgi:hypothetical protein
LVEDIAMTEPDGIQREPETPTPSPSGLKNSPSATPGQVSVAGPKKCPHCGHSLTSKDVEIGRCWFCEKRLTDPVQPRQPTTPFLATFLLGLVGASLGTVFAFLFLGETVGQASWTVSLCGGIGFATGSAVARLLFGKKADGSVSE